jgi:hypothetical protein
VASSPRHDHSPVRGIPCATLNGLPTPWPSSCGEEGHRRCSVWGEGEEVEERERSGVRVGHRRCLDRAGGGLCGMESGVRERVC